VPWRDGNSVPNGRSSPRLVAECERLARTSWSSAPPASAERPLPAGRKPCQRFDLASRVSGWCCMTCVGRSRQGCSASACASKPRGGAESSKWKPSWRSRDLSKARLGRGETRRTRRTFSPRRKAGCLQERCCHSAERAQARYSGKYGPDREAVLPGQAGSAISALPAPVRGRGLSYRAIRL
jgi:hypothetical protein